MSRDDGALSGEQRCPRCGGPDFEYLMETSVRMRVWYDRTMGRMTSGQTTAVGDVGSDWRATLCMICRYESDNRSEWEVDDERPT
jgi:hypothetical protein